MSVPMTAVQQVNLAIQRLQKFLPSVPPSFFPRGLPGSEVSAGSWALEQESGMVDRLTSGPFQQAGQLRSSSRKLAGERSILSFDARADGTSGYRTQPTSGFADIRWPRDQVIYATK